MLDTIIDLNWFGIAAATLAYYLLGALWFTPLFGKAWDMAVGFERPKGNRFPPMYYVVPLLSSLAVAMATAVLVHDLGITRLSQAVVLGLVAGIGYAAAVSFNNAVAPNTPRPVLLGAVTGGYHVCGIVLVALIITAIG